MLQACLIVYPFKTTLLDHIKILNFDTDHMFHKHPASLKYQLSNLACATLTSIRFIAHLQAFTIFDYQNQLYI